MVNKNIQMKYRLNSIWSDCNSNWYKIVDINKDIIYAKRLDLSVTLQLTNDNSVLIKKIYNPLEFK